MYKYIKKHIGKFRSWMNYDPPGAMTTRGWRLFKKEYKEQAPVRYWFTNNLRRSCILPIKWKYDEIRDWVRYRTYDRYHVLNTGLVPGYYGTEHLMLYSNFNMLKEFVEVEQAWSSYSWSDDRGKSSLAERYMPFYRKFFPFRRPDLGIKHFEWAATLDSPALPPHERSDQQARDAREVLALYRWWVDIRPARKEIGYKDFNHQGLGSLGSLDDDFDREADDYKEYLVSVDARNLQEEEWNKEDEEMLIRLVKIRKSLWT